MEKPKQDTLTISFLRHGKSYYQNYVQILGTNPQAPFNSEEQIIPELTSNQRNFVEEEATKFLENLNSEEDVLFFLSSNEARALETAQIFLKKAKDMGFEVMETYGDLNRAKARRERIFNEIDPEGKIRILSTLSLNPKNLLINSVFTPGKILNNIEINWENVDQTTKEKWEKAREIINKKDYGSWGANFFHYSKEVKKIFPELASDEDLFKQFKRLISLVRFAFKKIREYKEAHPDYDKNIRVIAFGHENYLLYALNKYFNTEPEIENCEEIKFIVDDNGDKIILKYRGKEVEVD